jgi:hypothetical protein
MEVLRRTDQLARTLLAFAFVSPRGPTLTRRSRHGPLRTRGWPRQLDEALTFCSLLDLANQGRLEQDPEGLLTVREWRPTGAPPHDRLLERIASSVLPAAECAWICELRREVAGSLLRQAIADGDLRPGLAPTWRRVTRYEVSDREGLEELRVAVGRVLGGGEDDPLATAVVLVCLASGVWQLLPPGERGPPARAEAPMTQDPERFPPPRWVRSRRQRLVRVWDHLDREPGPVLRTAFGPGAEAMGLRNLSDLADAVPQAVVVTVA